MYHIWYIVLEECVLGSGPEVKSLPLGWLLGSGPEVKSQTTVLWGLTRGLRVSLGG